MQRDRDEMEEIPPEKADKPGLPDEKSSEFRDRLKNFFKKKYYAQLVEAATQEKPFIMDYSILDRFGPDLGDLLIALPDTFFELSGKALEEMDLPGPVRLRVTNLPEIVMIRDLRSSHIGKFISTEGIIRKASEIRPEIVSIIWQCPACGDKIEVQRRGTFIGRPFECPACSNKKGFKEFEKKLIDTRWIVIEEPFELTEGEKPSQVTVLLTGDLTNVDSRPITEPGNRLRITGTLKDIPKSKLFSVKLDFYMETNHFEPTEIGWERIELSKADEERIKEISKDPKIYEMLVGSLAPSLYGLAEIKESIIMQLFGGVQRTQKDLTKTRGDIHVLIIGDPSSGKSQLMKLVPQIVPRGKYVSGKGASGAGLTATVSKDEQFMGGWVLEAGAMVLANKGLISIDEFEKMSQEDQVAMHEAMEQGCYEYGTELTMGDGSHVAIGDFVERHLKGMEGNATKDISPENIKVMSTDFNEVRQSKIKAVGRHFEDEMLTLRLSTGQELTITRKHPVFVMRKRGAEVVEARDVLAGDWVPVPNHVPVTGESHVFIFSNRTDSKTKGIRVPSKSSPDFCEWLGLVVGEGNAEINRGRKAGVGFTNSDPILVRRYISLLRKLFGLEPYVQSRGNVKMVRAISSNLRSFVESIGASVLDISYGKSLPDWVFTLPENEISALLRGLFDGEGSVNYNFGTVTFSTTSKKLAVQVQGLCQRLGIVSGVYDDRSLLGGRKRRAYKVQISSARNVRKFASSVGLSGKRGQKLRLLAKKESVSSKWDHVPNMMGTIESVKRTLRLSDTRSAGYVLSDVRRRDFISRPLLRKMTLAFEKRIEEIEKVSAGLDGMKSYTEYRKAREKLGISRSEVARALGMTQQELWYWKAVKKDGELLARSIEETKRIIASMLVAKETVFRLKTLADSPVEWVRVKSITHIRKRQPVYDIEVNPTRTFIGNGIVCHNSVSIAKASIVATLPAQTSVLAGGNPKFSRFDPYMPIAKQINIPDTLLSRFDLKFILRDIPDTKQDTKIVEHILSSREDDYADAIPKLDAQFIRKYITYAKRNCRPLLTKETGEMMKKFYVETRKRAQREGGAIPITLRQFEAMIRIAEASAKIQLSPTVRKRDAERAMRLMKFSMEQLGLVSETGEIDVDKFDGALTTSKDRSTIRIVLDIINELSRTKKEMLQNDVIEASKKEGVSNPEEIIERLKREGMLFEPSPGYVQKV